MAAVLGARVLGEFGDDPRRYTDGKARKNYAATSPITRASGKKKAVMARFIHNGRLIDAVMSQAQPALNASSGAGAFYDALRARGVEHNPLSAGLRDGPNALFLDCGHCFLPGFGCAPNLGRNRIPPLPGAP